MSRVKDWANHDFWITATCWWWMGEIFLYWSVQRLRLMLRPKLCSIEELWWVGGNIREGIVWLICDQIICRSGDEDATWLNPQDNVGRAGAVLSRWGSYAGTYEEFLVEDVWNGFYSIRFLNAERCLSTLVMSAGHTRPQWTQVETPVMDVWRSANEGHIEWHIISWRDNVSMLVVNLTILFSVNYISF